MAIKISTLPPPAMTSTAEKQSKQRSAGSLLSRDISFPQSLKVKDKFKLYEELSLLLRSGLDLEQSLALITAQAKNKSLFKKTMEGMSKNIIAGQSLSDAMQITKLFSDYEFYSIQIGEESGNLEAVLHELHAYYEERIEQGRKLVNALSYPVIVLLVAVSAVFFLLQFVVPLFEDVFKRFDGELPWITQVVISWSKQFGVVAPWLILFATSGIAILYINRKKRIIRKTGSALLLRLPLLGILIRKIYLARLFGALHLLVSARNPLLHSIGMIRKMISFYPLEVALEAVEEKVLSGTSLYESLAEHPIFEARIVALIKVAEEVGQLETVLDRIGNNLSKEVSHRLNTLGGMLEPVLIIFVGGLVAIILVSMYLPLFELSSSVY